MEQAQPFVKFVNNKLTLACNLDNIMLENVRVVSILGKARMGKSTFLNTIITRLTGQNHHIFQTKDTLDHCTKGIDYYYLASHNILLLDSQGLAHQNSSHDPALLLFLYLISDVIIFNERMMLQNEALKLLEPICTFMTYVDLDDTIKPRLYFRISDGDMIKDVKENLQNVMQHYDDQYQSIRESICHLFDPDIHLVKTDSLDKYSRNLLGTNDYISLLSRADLGFIQAITEILAILPSTNVKGMFNLNNKIPQIIEQINNNEKIKIEKLDIVGMTAKTEIRDWIEEKVSREYYAPIEVDGTQKCYEDKVETRKNLKKSILTAFTKQFKYVPASIVLPFRTKLDSDLGDPIKKATDDSIAKAEERVKGYVSAAFEDRLLIQINSQKNCLSTYLTNSKNTIFQKMNDLQKAVDLIYNPVKECHLGFIEKLKVQFVEEVEKIKKEEDEEKKVVQDYLDSSLEDFFDNYTETIEKFDKEMLLLTTNSHLLNTFIDKERIKMIEDISELVKPKNLYVRLTYKNIKITTNELKWFNGTIPLNHENIKELLEDYYKKIKGKESTLFQQIDSFVTKEKNKLLFGKKLDNSAEGLRIININKENIDFVTNNFIKGKIFARKDTLEPIVTRETYEKMIEPLLQKTFTKLVSEGYCTADCEIWDINTSNDLYLTISFKTGSLYLSNLSEIFGNELKKVYCQEYVKGNITW